MKANIHRPDRRDGENSRRRENTTDEIESGGDKGPITGAPAASAPNTPRPVARTPPAIGAGRRSIPLAA